MSSLVLPTRLKRLPEGVSADVIRVNGEDSIHGLTLNEKLYSVIENEAGAHNAEFNGDNFGRVLRAIKTKKIIAYFLIVKTDACSRPKFAGGAIEIPTVLTEWDGKEFIHYPAVHGEDTFVSPEVSAEFREHSKTIDNSSGVGLGTHFMHERIRMSLCNEQGGSPFGMPSRGRIAEYSEHSVPMIKLLKKLGATLGRQEDGTILQLDAYSPTLRISKKVPVFLEELGSQSEDTGTITKENSVFVTTWSGNGGKQRIAASFTEAISTFTGQPVVRVQFTTNGNIPKQDELKNVLANLILKGREVIQDREWINPGTGVLSERDPGMVTRFHALREPKIVAAMKELGAEVRQLGTHSMLPVITDLENTPVNVLGVEIREARPMVVMLPIRRTLAKSL